jgi:acylphosphatase
MPIARSIRIAGHVQGVFFREWTVMTARGLDIHGWVRNCRDGAVEVYAVGEPGRVDQFITELRKGSSASRVDEVEVQAAEPEDMSGFQRRGTV